MKNLGMTEAEAVAEVRRLTAPKADAAYADLCETSECPCGDPTLCGTRDAYVYAWGNNERRAALKGRPCVVLARGRMRTVLIQMIDTGEKLTTSARAIRRRKYAVA